MIPNKAHLELKVTKIEHFFIDHKNKYNFVTFINLCRDIFPPKIQQELNAILADFKETFRINTTVAQDLIERHYVEKKGGYVALKIIGDTETYRMRLNLHALLSAFYEIIVWCKKQINKIVIDQQLDFKEMSKADLYKQV